MASVNFSVPDDVKAEFNALFPGENKSAVLTALMRQAIEDRRRQRRRVAAIDALLRLPVDLDHHLFDTPYHAVALEREATLITADERYAHKAGPQGQLEFLGDFVLESRSA